MAENTWPNDIWRKAHNAQDHEVAPRSKRRPAFGPCGRERASPRCLFAVQTQNDQSLQPLRRKEDCLQSVRSEEGRFDL
jgi:hypothetical protein